MSNSMMFAVLFVVAGVAAATDTRGSEGVDAVGSVGGVVERRVMGNGAWLHDEISSQLPDGRLAGQLSVRVEYPPGLDWADQGVLDMNRQLNAWLARDGLSGASAKDGSLDVPNPPETTPPIGTRHPIVLSCATIKTSTSSSFSADITYTFEYRFTRDTNGDNKPDADPQWVIVDVKITPLFTDGQPHLC